jgi:hypothetical protein
MTRRVAPNAKAVIKGMEQDATTHRLLRGIGNACANIATQLQGLRDDFQAAMGQPTEEDVDGSDDRPVVKVCELFRNISDLGLPLQALKGLAKIGAKKGDKNKPKPASRYASVPDAWLRQLIWRQDEDSPAESKRSTKPKKSSNKVRMP